MPKARKLATAKTNGRLPAIHPHATALGHSESILRKHYLALVTKADAEKFWQLSP